MRNTILLVVLLSFAVVGIGATGCSPGKNPEADALSGGYSLPSSGKNFRLSLTDAPHPSLSNVFVTLDHVELLLHKGGKQGRLVLGEDIGTIDLLKLRDGVHLPIRDLSLQSEVVIKEFRLMLKDSGHWIVRSADGSMCDLKTPSQQKTGLKVKIPDGGITVQPNSIYSLVIDFDVDHSIVDNKNNCLLKPVLKIKHLVEAPENPTDGGGSDGGTDTGSDDGGSTGGDDSSGGSDDGSGSDGGTDTGSEDGGSTGGDDSSGGTDDGETPSCDPADLDGDCAPIIIEGDASFFT